MIKRILAGAAAAGFAATLLAAGPASADNVCSTHNPPAGRSNDKIADTTPGGFAYGKGGASGGYIGTQGATGWIEAGGSSSGAYVRGHESTDKLRGNLEAGSANGSRRLCVNGTSTPNA